MSTEGLSRVGSAGKGGMRLKQPVRLARPRPLRLQSSESPDQLIESLEGLVSGLQETPARVPSANQLSQVANNLKVLGPQMESNNKVEPKHDGIEHVLTIKKSLKNMSICQ